MVVGFEVWEWRSLDIFIMETRRVLEITATAKYEKAHEGIIEELSLVKVNDVPS